MNKAVLFLCLLLMLPFAAAMGEEIMTEACVTPAYDLPEGFVYVRDLIPDAIEEIRYATDHNFTGTVVDGYEAPFAIMTKEAAERLALAAEELRQMGYRIKIFDAYRPRRAVRCFVNWSEKEEDFSTKEEFYPDFKNRTQLVDQGYIARNSAHTRGSAIDLTITDMDGNELDMGTCFDYFGKKAWHGARDITPEQEQNRNILRTAMENAGFRPFEQEWWHYKLRGEPYPDTSFDFIVH
ncbi:MAG: peptidase M15 [Clostridiales bacterium]|nr:peptidase M15 [Clostridiales bacterium]